MSQQIAPDARAISGVRQRNWADWALGRRHNAAIQLLNHGREIDGELLLSLVVWPSAGLKREDARDHRDRAVR